MNIAKFNIHHRNHGYIFDMREHATWCGIVFVVFAWRRIILLSLGTCVYEYVVYFVRCLEEMEFTTDTIEFSLSWLLLLRMIMTMVYSGCKRI